MKKIHILENTLRYLLYEGRNAEKAKQKTIAVMRSYLSQNGVQGEQLEAMAMEYENSFKEWLFHANMPDSIIRLEPIMANVAMQLGFTPKNKDTEELYRLKDITSYIIENYDKEDFPIALNKLTLENTTFESLNELFGNAIDMDGGDESALIGNKKPPYHYSIKRLDTFEEAHKYYPYTQDICYLRTEGTWNDYMNNGKNTMYVLLRDGWQNVPAEHSEDTPYDDYGTSMIFVIIFPTGKIGYSNTRWNHNTNGQGPRDVDQSFAGKKIKYLNWILQAKYQNVLKPVNGKDEQIVSANIRKKGVDVDDLMKLSSTRYFGLFKDHIALFDNEGNRLSDWYDDFLETPYNFIEVKSDTLGKTCINLDGQRISDWFKNIDNFLKFHDDEGNKKDLAKVYNKYDMESYIDNNGQQICEWFDAIDGFYDGYARAYKRNIGVTFINLDGKRINEEWYKDANAFENGIAVVQSMEHQKWAFINTNGERICDWYKNVFNFSNGCALVQQDVGKWAFINTAGQQIGGWYKNARPFYDGYARVQRDDGRWSFINTRFKPICGWYKKVDRDINGLMEVQQDDGLWACINNKTHQITCSYIHREPFKGDFAIITRDDGKEAYINNNGEQIGGWFDYVWPFENDLTKVKLNHKFYYMDTNGNLYDYKTKQPISFQNESYTRLNNLIAEALNLSIKKYLLYN